MPSNIGVNTIGNLQKSNTEKKADDYGYVLILWDESGFSFVANCVRTWARVGHTPILFTVSLEYRSGRHDHTGIGYITWTPRRHLLKFHDGFAVQ